MLHRARIEYCNMIHKNSKRYRGTPPGSSGTLGNVIRKSAYKVTYITQNNEGLLMFFRNSRIRLFKISWLDCAQLWKESRQEKGTQST